MQQIILLHGALGSKDMLEPLANTLPDNWQVHTFNFSGHGGQPFPSAPFSSPLFADEIRSFMNAHAIEKAHLFGYSMGGYAALYLAKQFPDMVASVITLATKFYWDEQVAAKEAGMLNADKIRKKIPAFAAQLEQRHQPNDWTVLLEKTKEMMLRLGYQNTLQTTDYSSITTPTLLLLGDRDKMVSLEETIAVYKFLPNAQLGVLPGTPHPLEQVDINLLCRFIREL
jgi:pimeloyl-ACP methyl ester carboxylesterase